MEEAARRGVGRRAEIELTDSAPSGRVCADNPHHRWMLAAEGLKAAAKHAWTDVARFSAFGVDAVDFGPG